VKNYDGSWTEYGSLVGVPIALGEEPGEAPPRPSWGAAPAGAGSDTLSATGSEAGTVGPAVVGTASDRAVGTGSDALAAATAAESDEEPAGGDR
jgi:hypothetical protein